MSMGANLARLRCLRATRACWQRRPGDTYSCAMVQKRDPDRAEIVRFRPELAAEFRRLNLEWLERYFQVEPVDEAVLGDPVNHVLAGGGEILFAVIGEEAVGTCALKHHGGGIYELTKMAVTPQHQGQGLGRRLLAAAIERYGELSGSRLYLETHHALQAALRLYESAGFRLAERPPGLELYARSDVYMIYAPEGRAGAESGARQGPGGHE